MTAVAHGVEVGIKFSDDLELALVVDTVTISLFRRVEVGDVYGQVKGGQYEMTFGNMAKKTKDDQGEALMVTDTPLLQAAAANGDTSRPDMIKMTDRMTDGDKPKDSSAEESMKNVKQLKPESHLANDKYQKMIQWIHDTSVIREAETKIANAVRRSDDNEDQSFNPDDEKDMRAAVCAQLHDKPSIPHPPKRSIKVTTLQHLSPPNLSLIHI